MFIIEDYELENPNWDRSTDTIDTLNHDFHLLATQALVVGTVELAAAR